MFKSVICFVIIFTFTLRAQSGEGGLSGLLDKIPQSVFHKDPIELDLEDGKFKRESAKIYLPHQIDNDKKWPLVILLHGIGGTGDTQAQYLMLKPLVSIKGFVLVTPNGIATPEGTILPGGADFSGKQFWAATDYCCDFAETGVDDVLYIQNLLKYLKDHFPVDHDRVYIFGHSNGGFMANRLACEMGKDIAAIASFAGGNFKNLVNCETPVHYLQVHATNDSTVSYADHPLYAGGAATVAQWKSKNQCSGDGELTEEKDYVFLIPKKDTERLTWNHCESEKALELWKIKEHSTKNHNPHVPIFRPKFTNDVLNFLLSKNRN